MEDYGQNQIDPKALAGGITRPGFAQYIPGECLKPGSKLWSEMQRAQGIWLRGVLLTASEEEECIAEAQREGRLGAVGTYQVRRSFHAVADCIEAQREDGTRDLSPGLWRRVPALEHRATWEELGPLGRGIFVAAFQRSNTVSPEAMALAAASFRTIG